jgi:hypothetical protein
MGKISSPSLDAAACAATAGTRIDSAADLQSTVEQGLGGAVKGFFSKDGQAGGRKGGSKGRLSETPEKTALSLGMRPLLGGDINDRSRTAWEVGAAWTVMREGFLATNHPRFSTVLSAGRPLLVASMAHRAVVEAASRASEEGLVARKLTSNQNGVENVTHLRTQLRYQWNQLEEPVISLLQDILSRARETHERNAKSTNDASSTVRSNVAVAELAPAVRNPSRTGSWRKNKYRGPPKSCDALNADTPADAAAWCLFELGNLRRALRKAGILESSSSSSSSSSAPPPSLSSSSSPPPPGTMPVADDGTSGKRPLPPSEDTLGVAEKVAAQVVMNEASIAKDEESALAGVLALSQRLRGLWANVACAQDRVAAMTKTSAATFARDNWASGKRPPAPPDHVFPNGPPR